MTAFVRFPHTPHLAWLSSDKPRHDKVLTEAEVCSFLSGAVTVEEKVDGANIGVSLDSASQIKVQSRGRYLEKPYTGQFSRLQGWLHQHEAAFRGILDRQTIIFGEWCAAAHSIQYTHLPDWFILFDIFDLKEGKFLSVPRRNGLAAEAGLTCPPEIYRGKTTLSDLIVLISKRRSQFSQTPLEGVIVRRDCGDWCMARAKLVRAEFVQAISKHWSQQPLRWNRLALPS